MTQTMSTWFDESRLDDESALAAADLRLRQLAESGARVRLQAGEAAAATAEAVERARELARPRAVIAAGPDSRLLRAVLEPWCPVPFVAWPNPALPGWAGSLDLVVVLAPDGSDVGTASAVAEAVRRGCQVVVACPPSSMVAEHAAGRWSTILPTAAGDQLATAVVMLSYLDQVTLGPAADAEQVAQALDDVAIASSPHRDLAVNPAKMLAIALADTNPLVWGGSVLAARAARRVAESVRRASGRHRAGRRRRAPAAGHRGGPTPGRLRRPVRRESRLPAELRPMLLVLDDGAEEAVVREQRGRLQAAAAARGVRVETVSAEAPTEVARYASLLLSGTYAAAYLGIGLVEE